MDRLSRGIDNPEEDTARLCRQASRTDRNNFFSQLFVDSHSPFKPLRAENLRWVRSRVRYRSVGRTVHTPAPAADSLSIWLNAAAPRLLSIAALLCGMR